MIMNTKPILSLCIPTWNRSTFLRCSLERLLPQVKEINVEELEIIVSDNASDDDTPEVVSEFINRGIPITYNRNKENLGADGNFLKCIQMACAKYVFLLGDDDVFLPGALSKIITILKSGDYGLVHIHKYKKLREIEYKKYNDVNTFFGQISIWITFMSGNVFLREAYDKIATPEKYMRTNLLQTPFYIQSGLLRKENLIINQVLFEYSLDGESNGGYNFYHVFLRNYLNIWHEFVERGELEQKCYDNIQKKLLNEKLLEQNWYLLCLNVNAVKENDRGSEEFRKGYMKEDGWRLLFHYYGKKWYLYASFLIMPFLATYRRVAGRILSKINSKW